MIRAFWFITARSFKNRILLRLRRLREPRYLIGFIVGLFYLWFMVFRRILISPRGTVRISDLSLQTAFVDVLAIVALFAMILPWAWPEQSGGLTFSPAEIQFLFPAPLSRRELLLYKVFRQQPQILISATMMTIFGVRHSKLIGVWIPFVALSIYFTMVALARARLKLMGVGFWARLGGVALVYAGLGWLFVSSFVKSGMSAAQIQSGPSLLRAIEAPLNTPVIRAILFIPRLFAQAALRPSNTQLMVNCALLLVLAAIFLAVAGELNVRFEEASLRTSERRLARLARVRGQRAGRYVMFPRFPPPFRLRPSRHPELAIIWKNLIAALRISVAWIPFLAFIACMLVIPNLMTREVYLRGAGAIMALGFAGLFPFVASQAFAQDLRLDLPDMELLKSFPISGERLVAAEIATPLLLTSLMEIMMLSIAAVLTYRSHPHGVLAFFGTPQFVVTAILFVVPICAAQFVIRNAVVVLLPGWAVNSGEDQRGFVVVGQRLVFFAGNLLTLLFALLPAAVLFVPAFLISRAYFAGSAGVLAIATVPSVALLCFEIWLAIRFLGAQFEKVDVTTEVGVATI